MLQSLGFQSLGMIELSFVLLAFMMIILASGVWIGVGLGLVGLLAMILTTDSNIGQALATSVWSATSSWTLAALPLFIWMGEILFRTRLSEEMFRGLAPWVQWLPGRLMHTNIIGCGIFAAVSGSSAATCATIGKMTLPELEKRGYDRRLSLGTLAGSGTLGLLIPPSIPMVVYAVTANVSVLQVFLGGFLPGLLVMALYMGYVVIWSLLNPGKTPPRDPSIPFREKLRQSKKLAPIVSLILAVFLSLILGFATATEAAAWGVCGALLLAWWSGTLTWATLSESIMSATRMTCMIMLILAGAAFTTAAMGYTGIPAGLAQWVKGQNLSPHMLVMAMTIMYIILGCLIDGISMIVLTAVIVLPMVKEAGFNLIWFGVYLVIHVEMAQITPPVGFNLFVLQNMSGEDTISIAKAAFPFFILLNVAVIIITMFPEIVLVLPQLAFPEK
jgi:C4-dicarboxylate transporter, DctM subunit